MTFIDLFAGVGGFRRGLEMAGHKCVGFCEWDKYATMSYTSMHLITEEQREQLADMDLKERQKEILKEKYRNGEWYSNDIRGVDARNIPRADCWCFGAPCQDFSVAGHRAGLDGDRSSLVREVFRILREIEEKDRPEWLIYENVKGMLSSNRGFDYLSILTEMDEGGYDAEWFTFNSKYHGVPQNRERVYTVGHLRSKGQRKVFSFQGSDSEDSVQIEQIGMQKAKRHNPNQGRVYSTSGISPALNTMGGGGLEPHIPICVGNTNPSGRGENGYCYFSESVSPAVCCNKNDGQRVAVPVDCFDIKYQGMGRIGNMTEETPTLCARNYKDPLRVGIPVLTPERANKRQNGRRFKENEEDMFTLTAQDRHGVAIKVREAVQKGYTEAFEGDSINLSVPGSKTRRGRVGGQVAQTLDTGCNQGVMEVMRDIPEHPGHYIENYDGTLIYAVWYKKYNCYIAIRKLTPRECFRLQGWSDEYFERAEFVNLKSSSRPRYSFNFVKQIISACFNTSQIIHKWGISP